MDYRDGDQDFDVSSRGGFILWSAVFLSALGAPFFAFLIGKIVEAPLFEHLVGLKWPAIFSCAALFGALGVMLSLILRRRVDARFAELTMWRILIVVYGVGAVFALLLLALFLGGLVEGALFPRFLGTTWKVLLFQLSDWGKLAVWSFLAGFSERLMPSLFDQLIERALPKDDERAS